jgi:sugar-phosphatase
MIKAAIFDMDGVLIDSEPFWREADIKTFATVGVNLTEEMCLETMGLSCKGSIQYWYERFKWTSTKTHEQIKDEIEAYVVKRVLESGKPMPGVDYILSFFEKNNTQLALASSSSMHIIDAVLDRLNLRKRFKVTHSAQFEKAGKPEPDVFLTTAKLLGVKNEDCLVFEDSVNGVKAGLAAGMKVVAVPEAHMQSDDRYNIAHVKINSLLEYNGQLLSF